MCVCVGGGGGQFGISLGILPLKQQNDVMLMNLDKQLLIEPALELFSQDQQGILAIYMNAQLFFFFVFFGMCSLRLVPTYKLNIFSVLEMPDRV